MANQGPAHDADISRFVEQAVDRLLDRLAEVSSSIRHANGPGGTVFTVARPAPV